MKILLSGGGTAGHINPAIAIAQILSRAYPSASIEFVGTPCGMEGELVRRAGFKMHELAVEGLSRKATLRNIRVVARALLATKNAEKLLEAEKPSLVIGTGGYVCFPLLYAAERRKIPTVIHESNAYPGLVVKLLAKKADKVLLNFPSCGDHLPKCSRKIITGNPLRAGFEGLERTEARKKLSIKEGEKLLISFGGSLGAEKINNTMALAIPCLYRKYPDLHIVHATGKKNYSSFLKLFDSYFKADAKRVDILPYLEDMASYMTAADLLICRSGAMTLSEAAYTATPAILIPYPGATGDHQTKNAMTLAEQKAAVLIPDADLSPERLLAELDKILNSSDKLSAMKARISDFAIRDTDDRILDRKSVV